jgi:alkanesulfonate monooxygenase SsuD/methylene tetrahydromethanopterin reductase-like flavin-dependent oxidoreductase (luciferase family)
MSSMPPEIGLCFERTLAPGLVVEAARRLEAGGADRLWLIEDCFYTAGVSLAAAALAATDRLGVGIGILPAVARNPAITAMELATLCGLGPGRVLPGIGHGVQSWMGQIGARPASPVTALEEVLVAVRQLLGGERVTMHGHHVVLEDVELDQPPADPPPVLAGVRGPRSLAMAGRAAGGIVLAEPASPTFVRLALERAGRPPGFHVAVFAALCVAADRAEAQRRAAPWLAGSLDDPAPEIRALPFFDDMAALHAERGTEGLATMPAEWWAEIGPIGTLDDAVAHVEALGLAGVHSVGLLPIPRAEDLEPIDQVLAVAGAVDRV